MVNPENELNRELKRVFGPKAIPPLKARSLDELEAAKEEREMDKSLWHLGYPSLYATEFFLTAPTWRKWKTEKELWLPNKCCVCLAQPAFYLSVYRSSGLFGLWRRKEIVLNRAPHCEQHGQGGQAQLVVRVNEVSEKAILISVIGSNQSFLDDVTKLNKVGDVFPPWEAYPEYESITMGWREGPGEYWMNEAWWPFWKQLSEAERAAYLSKWNASEEWRDYLTKEYPFLFEKPSS